MLMRINEALLRVLARFQREEGQALAEYGLILALIAVVAIAALTTLGLAVSGKLGEISTALG
jgi:pilus assembly protein Flp/PilA